MAVVHEACIEAVQVEGGGGGERRERATLWNPCINQPFWLTTLAEMTFNVGKRNGSRMFGPDRD